MKFKSVNPTTTEAWKKLKAHFAEIKDVHMMDFFDQEPDRNEQYKIKWDEIQFDYSKNRINRKTLELLNELANEVGLKQAIQLQLEGYNINLTEDRAVLHTALRDFDQMKPEVKKALQKMKVFSNSVIKGNWKGFSNKAITDVVNIGIGGSDLGPKMVVNALQYYNNHLKVHYVSNVDGDHVAEILKNLNRETTLFVIVSKTFTTQETLANATTIKNWFLKDASQLDIEKHFVAVSSNIENAVNYQTGAIVWGNVGTNSQHAFFQLLHQGTKTIPIDFIGFKEPLHGNQYQHKLLMANFYGQSESLLKGTYQQNISNIYRTFKGNKPSNSLLINRLTPKSLGSLIALYEHKLFVQGVIWNIFSYDQFGVELGKKLAKKVLNDIESKASTIHDSSTRNLIDHFKSINKI